VRIVILVAAAVLVTAAYGAPAQIELPHFDVPRHCKTIAAVGGDYSETVYGGCMKMEQAGYDGLKAGWADAAEPVKRLCLEVAQSGDDGSYAVLSDCIERARGLPR
jgi:hypothetical protein